MRIDTERIKSHAKAAVAGLLREQEKLDLLFNADHSYLNPELRKTEVLDIRPTVVALSQSSPPILHSKLSEKVAASFVYFNPIKAECVRLGWSSRIVGFDNEYMPPNAAPESQPTGAVFIAAPEEGTLVQTNVRFDYRINVANQDGISVKTPPCPIGARLIDFSAGGAQIMVPGQASPPTLQTGTLMRLTMIFPWPEKKSRTQVNSIAEVMWMDYVNEHRSTRLGLRFRDMDMETRRVFSKIINHYMLVEQRTRKVAGQEISG